MKDNLILEGKNYISAKRAARIINYAQDYVGQLCRSGKLDCRMVGRSWFVTEESLLAHRALSIHAEVVEKVGEKIGEERIGEKLEEEKEEIKEEVTEEVTEEVSSFKYEAEQTPFLPALGKKVPSDFSIPKNASSIVIPSFHFDARKASMANSLFIILFITAMGMSALIFSSSIQIPGSSGSLASAGSATREIVDRIMRGVTGLSERFPTRSSGVIPADEVSPEAVLSGGGTNSGTNSGTDGGFNGIGIVPSSSSAGADEEEKKRIRNSFSDEVMIKPDESGTAGVITPVFRKTNGDDFVYVLVPVKEEKK